MPGSQSELRSVKPQPAHELLSSALEQLNQVILGKDDRLRLCITCLLARGHLLIEDIPGVGKTTLAHIISNEMAMVIPWNSMV